MFDNERKAVFALIFVIEGKNTKTLKQIRLVKTQKKLIVSIATSRKVYLLCYTISLTKKMEGEIWRESIIKDTYVTIGFSYTYINEHKIDVRCLKIQKTI